jgi:hypothetical protein
MVGWLDDADKIASVVAGLIGLAGAAIALWHWRRHRQEAAAKAEHDRIRAAIDRAITPKERLIAEVRRRMDGRYRLSARPAYLRYRVILLAGIAIAVAIVWHVLMK